MAQHRRCGWCCTAGCAGCRRSRPVCPAAAARLAPWFRVPLCWPQAVVAAAAAGNTALHLPAAAWRTARLCHGLACVPLPALSLPLSAMPPCRREYPTTADAYDLVEECGRGVSATVSAAGQHPQCRAQPPPLCNGSPACHGLRLLSPILRPPVLPAAQHQCCCLLAFFWQVYRAICKPYQEEVRANGVGGQSHSPLLGLCPGKHWLLALC